MAILECGAVGPIDRGGREAMMSKDRRRTTRRTQARRHPPFPLDPTRPYQPRPTNSRHPAAGRPRSDAAGGRAFPPAAGGARTGGAGRAAGLRRHCAVLRGEGGRGAYRALCGYDMRKDGLRWGWEGGGVGDWGVDRLTDALDFHHPYPQKPKTRPCRRRRRTPTSWWRRTISGPASSAWCAARTWRLRSR